MCFYLARGFGSEKFGFSGKRLWRFAIEEVNALWRKSNGKYGSEWGGWYSKEGRKGMALVFGSLLKRGGSCFPGISTLKLVEDLRFDFGVICGVVIRL